MKAVLYDSPKRVAIFQICSLRFGPRFSRVVIAKPLRTFARLALRILAKENRHHPMPVLTT
jgi:hypothetical protein